MSQDMEMVSMDMPTNDSFMDESSQGRGIAKSKTPEEQVEGFLSTYAASAVNDGEKKFIRTATLDLLVDDVVKATHDIENIVIAKKGFIIQSSLNSDKWNVSETRVAKDSVLIKSKYTVRGKLILRVDHALLDEVLREIMPLVKEVTKRDLTANDITFDLVEKQMAQDRKKDKSERLKKVTQSGQSHKLDDVIDAEESIDRAREQSDMAKLNEMKLYDQVEYSTIYIDLMQEAFTISETRWIEKEPEEYRGNFFWKTMDAFSYGCNGLIGVIPALIAIWPVWVIIGVVVCFILRYRKKRKP